MGGEGEGGREVGKVRSRSMEEWEKNSVQAFSNPFFKILTEGAVTTSSTSQPSPKKLALSSGGGSYLVGVPYKTA